RPSNACGEVTSWIRWRSTKSSTGSPGSSRTTCDSQIFSKSVRGISILSLPHQEPAVEVERSARNVPRFAGGEVDDCCPHLVGAAQAADRDRFGDLLSTLFWERVERWAFDRVRCDCIHGHAVLRKRLREDLRQDDERRLRRGVVDPADKPARLPRERR